MDDDDLAIAIILGILHRGRRRRRIRRLWIHYIFTRRRQQGEFHNLLQELRVCQIQSFTSDI